MRVGDAITFMAADRQHVDEAYAGDIIGLHNHGTINIGDSFTQGEALVFTGIPSFAPELFRRAVLRDPLKLKALQKGLAQLCEEGATQLFRPLLGNDLILGAVGSAAVRGRGVPFARRVRGRLRVRERRRRGGPLGALRRRSSSSTSSRRNCPRTSLATMPAQLVYLAPTNVSLTLTQERWPKVQFFATRELSAAA